MITLQRLREIQSAPMPTSIQRLEEIWQDIEEDLRGEIDDLRQENAELRRVGRNMVLMLSLLYFLQSKGRHEEATQRLEGYLEVLQDHVDVLDKSYVHD